MDCLSINDNVLTLTLYLAVKTFSSDEKNMTREVNNMARELNILTCELNIMAREFKRFFTSTKRT